MQPVAVAFSHPGLVIWTRNQPHSPLTSLLLCLATPLQRLTVTFLPTYSPSVEERADPVVFAAGVQARMAETLGLDTTDITRQSLRNPPKV